LKIEDTLDEIDYELLKQKQEFLFYEEIILFEDELHDNGISKFTVKSVSDLFLI
jgi:type 2A phosphatase activator TIP41